MLRHAGAHLSKELEEELNRDSATKEDSSTGCWVSFTKFVASEFGKISLFGGRFLQRKYCVTRSVGHDGHGRGRGEGGDGQDDSEGGPHIPGFPLHSHLRFVLNINVKIKLALF